MSYWVAGHITGGLGNRLFQHASAMGLAEKWGHEVVFYLPQMAPTEHGPFENIMKLFPSIRIQTEEQKYVTLYEPNGNVFTYTPFQGDPIRQNVLIDGWRQTAKYFPCQGIDLPLEKVIPYERHQELLNKYNLFSERETTCFLHIRMGDYKILPHHQIDIGTYMSRAAKEFQPGTRFLVFSDEATQFKEMFEDFVKTIGHIPVVVEETDELENLFLMSQCWGGAIVGNSTFSWWGAYCARRRCPTKETFIACYPQQWGAGLPPARDVIPSWGTSVNTM